MLLHGGLFSSAPGRRVLQVYLFATILHDPDKKIRYGNMRFICMLLTAATGARRSVQASAERSAGFLSCPV
jgi:hypothetical protein